MSGTKGHGATLLAAQMRQQTDDRIMQAFEDNGVLSKAQVVEITGISDSTVCLAIERLRQIGMLRKLEEKRRTGKRGIFACVYEIGQDEDAPLKREPVEFTVHRHAHDVALFGEYRRMAE